MEKIEQFEKALLSVDRITAKGLFSQYVNEIDVMRGVQELITPALESIGTKWSNGKISLAQVYMSGRISEELVDIILPSNGESGKEQPNIAITTLNDFHLLGKRIVYSILRSVGINILDLGRKEVDDLVIAVKENNIQILLVSVLMLISALKVRELKNKLADQGNSVKVVVGGAPFRMDTDLWNEVGADASGLNASDSIRLVRILQAVSYDN